MSSADVQVRPHEAFSMAMAPAFGSWQEFEHTEPSSGDDSTDDVASVQVRLPDGRRHDLDVWMFKFLQRARFRWPYETTSPQAAEYVVAPDLFVECLDRPTPEGVVRQLLADGGMKAEWRRPPNRKPPNQALHLTAAAGSVFGVQGLTGRRGR